LSINLVVGGVTYAYPETNSELWGNSATDWAQAVTQQLQQVSVVGDIGPTTLVTVVNNQATPANVTNLLMNPALIRAGFAEYYVVRTTAGTEISEAGMLYLLYNDLAATWSIANVGNAVGSTGVTFSVNSLGQVQYTSTNIPLQTSGKLKYRLRILQKT
jgi:hypothetical protein